MSDLVITDEEQAALEEGEAARFLLTQPLFLQAIETVREDCSEAILRSPPEAKQAREDAYNLSRALSAVTLALDALAARAEAITAQHEQAQLADPEEDDGGVHTY